MVPLLGPGEVLTGGGDGWRTSPPISFLTSAQVRFGVESLVKGHKVHTHDKGGKFAYSRRGFAAAFFLSSCNRLCSLSSTEC